MASVLCIGISVMDHVFQVDAMPTRAEKYRAHGLATVGGGIAANSAVAVARQGGRSHLITRLGEDALGKAILEDIAAEGVDIGLSRRFAGIRSQLSAILVDKAGERMIISYSDPEMPDSADWLPRQLPEGVDAVLGDTRWQTGARHVMNIARAAGKPAVMDIDRKPDDAGLIDSCTHAALSAQAAVEMTGERDLRRALGALRSRHSCWLAITDGGNGVWWTNGGDIEHSPAFEVEVRDTLGAGDVWHGAFALGLAEGMAAGKAVRYASAVAALKCTTFGGRAGIPTRAAAEAFLRERT
ncbi:MAG: PfkB family carbohydrate kinase [Beijerinckiaceae bacterium]